MTLPKKNRLIEYFLKFITLLAASITFLALLFIIAFILIKGIPFLKPSLFSLHYTSDNVSLLPALISTLIITALSLLIAAPVAIFSAIYLTEYAKKGNHLVNIIRITTETLAGIPSIVYGLFGLLFFVSFLGWGFSVLSGAFTLALMILPLMLRSSEEAILAVPSNYREGAFALGAGKLRTIFKIILPSASNGILSGVVLGIGRIVGESAALIYTAGTVAQIPIHTNQSARTLAVHMYAISSEGFHTNEAYATAVVLLLIVVILNMILAAIAKKFMR